MNLVKEKAYAKINLYLNVLNKRKDGFHDISTVMHSLSLCDDITVILNGTKERKITLRVNNCDFIPSDNKNLAYKAAELFLNTIQREAEIEIIINKRIPVSAGLAGGSSDAAAVLRAMNSLFGFPFCYEELSNIALKIGSDVPYCILGGTSLCQGRGEIINKISTHLHLFTVIAVGNEHISTPKAYTALDILYSNFDGSVKNRGELYLDELIKAFYDSKLPNCGLYNIFEEAVLENCKKASKIKSEMIDLGAEFSLMSGSGPSVFGIFSDEKKAKYAEKILKDNNIIAFYAQSV